MLDPAFDTSNPVGSMWWNCSGEMLPRRFGNWGSAGHAGVAALILLHVRGYVDTSLGFRLAYIS